MRKSTVLCALVILGWPNVRAVAQVKPSIDPVTIERFAQRLVKLGGASRALIAPDAELTNVARRGIADTLVAIAIASSFTVVTAMPNPDIIEAFLSAAKSSDADKRDLGLRKIRELVDNPSNQSASSLAVFAYTLLDDKTKAIESLDEIAISHSLGAFLAVRYLATAVGEDGRTALKRIATQNLAVQPEARKEADYYARLFKWK